MMPRGRAGDGELEIQLERPYRGAVTVQEPREGDRTGPEPGPVGASILRDPGAPGPEKSSAAALAADFEGPGSPRSSPAGLERTPGTPDRALEWALLFDLPRTATFELTPKGWAELRRIRLSSEWIHGPRTEELIRKSLEDNERDLDRRAIARLATLGARDAEREEIDP